MTSGVEFYNHITHPKAIDELLEIFCQPGGASIALESAPEVQLPVLVETTNVGPELCLNITAIGDKIQVQAITEGAAYRVLGGGQRGLVRTPVLTAQRIWEEYGKLYCRSEFPPHLEKLQRRETFRAELRQSMRVRVDLHVGEQIVTGWLQDLSITGCLVNLEASAALQLDEHHGSLKLEMTFPDGSHLMAPVTPHHKSVQDGSVLCGFSLDIITKEQQHQMWYIVHETEREAARSAQSEHDNLRPSPLYRGSAYEEVSRPAANTYATPMARRLSHCATWLATVILQLRQGEHIDSTQLSQQSEYLLSLHDRDREGLLYALVCMHNEPTLVQHCLAIATRLIDITAGQSLPPAMRKALAAAGLIHDLGKELLPTPLRNVKRLDGDQYAQYQEHVALVRQRLDQCQWLSPAAIDAVVEGANERLDGSGYPNHRDGDQQNQLMRLTAIVDVADAMGRNRVDRPGMPIDQIYQHLLRSPEQFDPRWVKRYIKHFGRWPIGTLVRYENGQLGWILALDDKKQPVRVRQVDNAGSPDTTDGTIASGDTLAALGNPVEALSMAEYA